MMNIASELSSHNCTMTGALWHGDCVTSVAQLLGGGILIYAFSLVGDLYPNFLARFMANSFLTTRLKQSSF